MDATAATDLTAESVWCLRLVETGLVLLTLGAGQFLVTLDSSVMNVSIATVAGDNGTTITGIQTAITLYTLIMAAGAIASSPPGCPPSIRRRFATPAAASPETIAWASPPSRANPGADLMLIRSFTPGGFLDSG